MDTIKAIGRFLLLALRPLPGWWAVMTAVPAVAGLILTVIVWLTKHAAWGSVTLVALIAYLFLVAGTRLQRYKDHSLHPNLAFGEMWDDVCDLGDAQGRTIGQAALVGGSIINNPPGHRPEQAISEAFVTLEVLGNGIRHRVETRWRESPQHVEKPKWDPKQLSKITLHPNDESHPFDVVARPNGATNAFVFAVPHLAVPPGRFTVNVTVRGVGLDPNWVGAMKLDTPTDPEEPMRIAVVSGGRRRSETASLLQPSLVGRTMLRDESYMPYFRRRAPFGPLPNEAEDRGVAKQSRRWWPRVSGQQTGSNRPL
jgi:hypothetical protein